MCIPLKGIEGSNPSVSAKSIFKEIKSPQIIDFPGFFIFPFTDPVKKQQLTSVHELPHTTLQSANGSCRYSRT